MSAEVEVKITPGAVLDDEAIEFCALRFKLRKDGKIEYHQEYYGLPNTVPLDQARHCYTVFAAARNTAELISSQAEELGRALEMMEAIEDIINEQSNNSGEGSTGDGQPTDDNLSGDGEGSAVLEVRREEDAPDSSSDR